MKYIYIEFAKYNRPFLQKVFLALVIAQLIFMFGLITSFDESYKMWKSVVDRTTSPTYFYMYQAQKGFYYFYAVIVITSCGYIHYIENQYNTWRLLINMPVSIKNIMMAKVTLNFLTVLFLSAILVGMHYIGFNVITTTSPLLKEASIPSILWYSWWLHFSLTLPIPLFIMHCLAMVTKSRIAVFAIIPIFAYIILSITKLAPGISILSAGTTPLSDYLDLLDINSIIISYLLTIVMFFFLSRLFRIRLIQLIINKQYV